MTLRAATLDDTLELAQLSREAFVAAFGHLYRPEDLATYLAEYRTPAKYREYLADPAAQLQVVEARGCLAAYCMIVPGQGFESRPDPRPEKSVLISQLYCAPDMTGRGYGAKLLEWAIDAARGWGADAIQLSVYSENFGAQRFYQRFGFVKVADLDFWVGNHRDAEFLYELPLR